MRTMRASLGLVCAVAAAVGLTGCNSVPQRDYEAALAEAAEIRDQLADARDQLAACNARSADLEQDLLFAQGEVDRLNASPVAATTGFENINGASVSGRGQDIVVNVAGDVLFDSGRVKLKSNSRSTLDRIASVIQSQYAGNTIRVEGYTDGDPIVKSEWKTNERLSAERAMAVEQYLVGRGVRADRIYAAAFGDANPRSSKAQSRRVEIVILGS
ncbi:MAG: OmpA family protein [Planctomycetota bacterium]